MFPVFVDKTRALLTDAVKAFGEQLPQKLTDMSESGKSPRTLVHGDFRLENVFFGTSLGESGFAVIDWQDISRGEGFGTLHGLSEGVYKLHQKDKQQNLSRRRYGV